MNITNNLTRGGTLVKAPLNQDRGLPLRDISEKPRVLMIDNDKAIRLLVDISLTRIGCEVQTHSTMEKALPVAFEEHFDLIVTGFAMEGMNGLNFTHCLREKGNNVPIVMIIGTFHPGVFSVAKKVGINHVMSKPFHEETILQVVHGLLGQEFQLAGGISS